MAKYGYRTLITNLKSTISGHANLNDNLTKAVAQVVSGDPFVLPIPATLYPSVVIDLVRKDEDWGQLGRQKHTVTLILNIYCLTYTQGATGDQGDQEVQYLTDNIESILRDDPTLGNTVNWIMPGSADFATGFKDGKNLACSVIEAKVNKLV